MFDERNKGAVAIAVAKPIRLAGSDNDNVPARAAVASASGPKRLRVEANGKINDFLVSPSDEEQLMALIAQISACSELNHSPRESSQAGRALWLTIATILTVTAGCCVLAWIYI